MVIWEGSGTQMRRGSYAAVFGILLCALVIGASEGVRRTKETFWRDGGADWVPHQDIDQDMAEQVWVHCTKELIDGKDAVENFDLYIPQDATSDLEAVFLTKRNKHNEILDLPPDVKQTLVDCLRKKGVLFHASGKRASSNNWYIYCLEWLLGWPNAPRRYLASDSDRPMEPSPAPSLAPGPARVPAPGPARVPTPGPARIPAPGPARILAQNPPAKSPEKKAPSGSSSKKSPTASDSVPKPPSKEAKEKNTPSKKSDSSRTKIIAIAGTVAVTIVVFALFLFCCLKKKRNTQVGPRNEQKDDRPLLTLASAGSSQKSTSIGNVSNKEFNASVKFVNNLSMKNENDSSLAEAKSSEATAAAPLPLLPPPPGRPAPPPPGPPPPPPPRARPPPPPKAAPIPPKPLPGRTQIPPVGAHRKGKSGDSGDFDGDGSQKAKLKPFFWDKVVANPDQSMVWNDISAGSFQFNEEQIESLFGYAAVDKNKIERRKESSSLEPAIQYIQIIDRRKAQNLSILLRALNVTTEEVADALREGNELPVELLQTLLKMAPTSEEELKLRLFTGDLSQLGPAERFLKVMVDIPFAFKRIESLLFMCSLPEEVSNAKESFATLEVACNKLRKSRLFLKLLEAVLKTGNRMNDGTYRGGAQAFRLDTLLKLSDVKGTDGKTTLLHFVVQEIIRSEGVRAARAAKASRSMSNMSTEDFVEDIGEESPEHYRSLGLQVVSGLSDELEDVKKAALVDSDGLTSTVANLGQSLLKTREFINIEMKNLDEDSEFQRTLASFVERAESDITLLLEEEKRITALVKSTADYFHGNAGKDEGIRLFAIVREFLVMLNKACTEVRNAAMKAGKLAKKEAPTTANSKEAPTAASSKEAPTAATSENGQPPSENSQPPSENRQPPADFQQSAAEMRQKLFPAIAERRMDISSSDDEE